MSAASAVLDLFPETRPQGPVLRPYTGADFEPEAVIELRGVPVPYRTRNRNVVKGDGRRFVQSYVAAHVRKFQSDLRLAAQDAMGDRPLFDGPLEVWITAYLPPPQALSRRRTEMALRGELRPTTRPDLDNYCKASADACTAVVWRDDAQIVRLVLEKFYAVDPRLRIEVRRLPTCP